MTQFDPYTPGTRIVINAGPHAGKFAVVISRSAGWLAVTTDDDAATELKLRGKDIAPAPKAEPVVAPSATEVADALDASIDDMRARGLIDASGKLTKAGREAQRAAIRGNQPERNAVTGEPSRVAKQPVRTSAKAKTPCRCGCGELVTNAFRMGHDARFHGWMTRIARGVLTVDELPFGGYAAKFMGIVDGMPTRDWDGGDCSRWTKAE